MVKGTFLSMIILVFYFTSFSQGINYEKEPRYNRSNLKQGVYNEYFENGNIKTTSYFNNDTIEGLSIEFYENGNIRMVSQYSQGKKNGMSILYLKNGGLYAKFNNFNGNRIEGFFYDIETGKIEKEEYFDCSGRNICSFIYEEDGTVHILVNKAYR